ncbi:T-cell activation Rho GTPase-activating protein-like [Heliangelus exortis]|uniref:T-cell activation Rho GTPase-activating protein-like n=1 Tax=Heliangelus exortis TaxID=472823 RepID=UPI003A902591
MVQPLGPRSSRLPHAQHCLLCRNEGERVPVRSLEVLLRVGQSTGDAACAPSWQRWPKPLPQPQPLALQDFLREIPSKLLEEELYEEWMRALQKTSRQEGLAALKEVASKLPEANLQLLRSLLALLGAISSNADTTSMTAGNLAICLGPSLLSPPQEQTLPLDELLQVTGKVIHVVEFLIDHHRELFEEEAAALGTAVAEEAEAPEAEGETSEQRPPVV